MLRNRSKGDTHGIIGAKGLVAIRTLPGARGCSLLDALFAEDVAAGLDDGVFEIFVADSADGHDLVDELVNGSDEHELWNPYAKHFVLAALIAQAFRLP